MVNLGFWKKSKSPILCLAPMADVTDAAFRYIIAKYSKLARSPEKTSSSVPSERDWRELEEFSSKKISVQSEKNVFSGLYPYATWTEFVSADGLVRAPEEGRKKLLKDLEYSEIERPIVAQFFTSKPEMMEKAAALAVELGFDGIDINMGCPDKSIEKQGAGAALIKNPTLAKEIILAAKRGVALRQAQGERQLPVSVKTRLGYNKDELETWLPALLEAEPAVMTIHARTRKEMSKVPARWERIRRAVEIRDEIQRTSPLATLLEAGEGKNEEGKTLIFGNGDVLSVEDAYKKCAETGADGAMLGRAIFGNPFLFSGHTPTLEEKLKVLVEHSKLFEQKLGAIKNFAVMKKHFKSYIGSFSHSKDLREKLMEAESAGDVENVVSNFLISYN